MYTMTQKKDFELKPCPFCGCNAILNTRMHYGTKQYHVVCDNYECNASSGWYVDNKELAIKRWNRRINDEQAD